jgi:gliding motility-associated lipoprotein GldB
MIVRNFLRTSVLVLFWSCQFWSCQNETTLKNKIAAIEVDFVVERFDSVFALATPNILPQLKSDYPFLFSKHIADSIWYERMQDTLQKQMFTEVQNAFGDFEKPKMKLRQLFQHLKYYDKTFSIPRVICLANNVDYRNKTIVNDSLVLIDLMNYLGHDHEFYQNKALFISENMRASQLLPDVSENYAKIYAYQSGRKSLLDEMIHFGKLLYFKDIMIPEFSDAEKMGYTTTHIEWAKINEAQIWSYFVEREMLFSSDPKLFSRFIAPAPFSKFYLELDNESPGRIGQYLGWQIVRAYAKRTNADVLQIMRTEADDIFIKSKYKPEQ